MDRKKNSGKKIITQTFKGLGQKLEKGAARITVFRKFIIELPIIIFVVLFFGFIILNEFFSGNGVEEEYSLGNFSVPKPYVEMGYTSQVIGNLISEKVAEKQSLARESLDKLKSSLNNSILGFKPQTLQENQDQPSSVYSGEVFSFEDSNLAASATRLSIIVPDLSDTGLSVEVFVRDVNIISGDDLSGLPETKQLSVPGTGLTIDNILNVLKEVFKIENKTKVINGDIICQDLFCSTGELTLNFRFYDPGGNFLNVPVFGKSIEGLIDKAAEEVLRLTSPKDLALYYYGCVFEIEECEDPENPKESKRILSKLHSAPFYAMKFEIRHLHGLIFLFEKDFRSAASHFEKADSHGEPKLWNTLFWAYSVLTLEAKEDFSRVEGIEKNSDQLFEIALELALKEEKSDAYHFWGASLYSVTLYDQAEKKFETALNDNPDDYRVLNIWGQMLTETMLTETGNYEEAISKFEKASSMARKVDNNYLVNIYNNWALTLILKAISLPFEDVQGFNDNLSSAEELYQKITKLTPDDHYAHYYLGVIRSSMGKCEEAFDSLLTSVEIKEDFVDGYLSLGDSLSCMEEYELAGLSFEEAAYWNQGGYWEQDNAESFFQWGYALFESDDLAGATEKFEQAVALNDNFATAHLLLGILYAMDGRTTEAEAEILKALQIDPSLEEVLVEFMSDGDSA